MAAKLEPTLPGGPPTLADDVSEGDLAVEQGAHHQLGARGHAIALLGGLDVLVDGVAGPGTAPVYPSPFSRVRLQAFANNAIGCYWDDAGLATVFNTFDVTGPATLAVVSSPSVHVTYFEVLR